MLSVNAAAALGKATKAVLTLSQKRDSNEDRTPDEAAVRVVSLDGRTASGSIGPGLADWGCANRIIKAGADLAGCRLTGANLTGLALNRIDLSNSELIAVNFKDATLTGVKFTKAKLSYANFANTGQ